MPDDPQQPEEPRDDAPEQPSTPPVDPPAPPAGVAAESGTDEPAVEAEGEVESEAAPEPEAEAVSEEEAGEEEAPPAEPEAEVVSEEEAGEEEPAPEPVAGAEEEAASAAAPAAEGEAPGAQAAAVDDQAAGVEAGEAGAPLAKPEIPGADLEPDIVLEGADPLGGRPRSEIPGADLEPDIVAEGEDALAALEDEDALAGDAQADDEEPQRITQAAIDLAAGARYRATGKRKTSIARVILRPGDGAYTINGRPLDRHFPRATLQRTIRQPLETVGYEGRMDVVATLRGGGVSGQAGALRHGIARALIEADPNLRAELKRRGFLTRDARVKERKKAGLKKARKRPQFSKR